MKKWMVILAVMAAVVPIGLSARDDDPVIVKFDGGIGVDPVGGSILVGAVRSATLNTVRGIAPGGLPWTIRNLKATVEVGGELDLKGRGLVLAGGNLIGTSAGLTVRAMLFCGTGAFTSPSATLDPHGDFEIDGFLSPTPPNPCNDPALLIVTGATPAWLAAGIPDNDDKN